MTERGMFAQEGVVLRGMEVKSGLPLEPSQRARKIADSLVKIVVEKDDKKRNRKMAAFATSMTEKFATYNRRVVNFDQFGEALAKGRVNDMDKAAKFRDDLKVAVALVAQELIVASYDGNISESAKERLGKFRQAIDSKRWREADEFLMGGVEKGGVLEGASERVASGLITNEKVLGVLKGIQVRLARNSMTEKALVNLDNQLNALVVGVDETGIEQISKVQIWIDELRGRGIPGKDLRGSETTLKEIERMVRENRGVVDPDVYNLLAANANRGSAEFGGTILGKSNEEVAAMSEMEQLSGVRAVLDVIESTDRDTTDWAIAAKVAGLEALKGSLTEDVWQELEFRVKLIDCYIGMRKANGWIEAPPAGGWTVANAAGAAFEKNHELDRNSIDFFFSPEPKAGGLAGNGLKLREAWNLMQRANYEYVDVLKHIERTQGLREGEISARGLEISLDDDPALGTVGVNFYTDGDGVRKERVRESMVEWLGGGAEAKKAIQLAERLILATAESSVFNRTAMAGNDHLAEMMGLRGWREGRYRLGRNAGPPVHVHEIPGFGNTFLRNTVGHSDVRTMLLAEEVWRGINRFESGGYNYFFTVMLPAKWQPLKEALLDLRPDPKKILDRGWFRGAVDYFNKADPKYDRVLAPNGKYYVVRKGTRAGLGGRPEEYRYVKYKGKEYDLMVVAGTEKLKDKRYQVEFRRGLGRKMVRLVEKTPEGKLRLKSWWLAGVLQMASTGAASGWTYMNLLDLKRLVSGKGMTDTSAELSPEAGPFLPEETVDWAFKLTDALEIMRKKEDVLNRRAALGIRG